MKSEISGENTEAFGKTPKELLGKLFYVWRKTQVRLSSNVLAFLERCFWVFWEGKESEDFWGLSLLEWDKLWIKWKFLFVLCISWFGRFVLCNWLFCMIMYVFWLILCSSEIESRRFIAKNEITGFRVAKLQNSDVEECDLTFCYIDILYLVLC